MIIKLLKQAFCRKNSLPVELGRLSIQQIMHLPARENARLQEYYIKAIYSENHVQISKIKRVAYGSGIHDFHYDETKKQIHIFSRFERPAFLIYGYLILPLIPLMVNEKARDHTVHIIGIFMLLLIALSLILILGIRAESKNLERELIIRLNHRRQDINEV